MQLVGSRGQSVFDHAYRLDGKITTGGTSQLISPIPFSRSHYLFQNSSANAMWLEFGSARAVCTISNGAVNAITVVNGGFGFTSPPRVKFEGGALYSPQIAVGPSGAGLAGYASPSNAPNNAAGRPATAHAVLTGGVVTSIVIDDGGAGYAFAPFMQIQNADSDRYGCADPYYGSANSGLYMGPGAEYYVNGTTCDTEQISVWCATTGSTYFFRWMA